MFAWGAVKVPNTGAVKVPPIMTFMVSMMMMMMTFDDNDYADDDADGHDDDDDFTIS